MGGDSTLQIVIKAKDEATQTLKGVGSSLGSVSKGASIVNAALIGTAVAIAGVSAYSIKMAGDFQSSLTTLVTGAGESVGAINMIRDGILNMATQVGDTPLELSNGIYMIESAGYHGATALKILQAAAEGAKVGNADLATTTDAVTTVMKDYKLSADQSTDATNFLVGVVKQGKTHMQDLSQSLAQILPIASSLNIPLDQVGGAIAAMTARGIPAANAATNLRFTISALAKPTSAAAKIMESFGMTSTEVGTVLTKQGLLPALQLIQNQVEKKFPQGSAQYVAAISGMLGGTRGLQAGLSLTGSNMQDFINASKTVSQQMNTSKGSVLGWSNVQNDFDFQMQKVGADVQVLAVNFGDKLLPILTKGAAFVASNLIPTVMNLANWAKKNGEILGVLAGVVTGVVLPALAIYYTTMGVNAVASVLKFFAAQYQVIGALWAGVTAQDANTAAASKSTATMVGFALKSAVAWVASGVKMVAAAVTAYVKMAAQAAISAAQTTAAWIATKAQMVASFVASSVAAVVNAAKSAVAWVVAAHQSEDGFVGSLLKIVGKMIYTGAQALVNAAIASAAWVASSAKATAQFIMDIPKIIANFVLTSASAVKNAVIASIAWVTSSSQASAGWVASSAKAVVAFVAMGLSAVKNAAIATVAFVAQTAKVIALGVATEAVKAATVIWTGAQWLLNAALTANPIGLVIIGVAALVAGVIFAYTHIKGFRDAINDLWTMFKNFIGWVVGNAMKPIQDLANLISKIPGVGGAANAIGSLTSHLPHFQDGGFVPQTGLAVVHQGEFILSRAMLAGNQSIPSNVSNSTTNNNTPINIYATVSDKIDMNLLGSQVAFALRNSR